jgi:tRNA threonylcarbamoyladenosine biosynthesis protein TsaE
MVDKSIQITCKREEDLREAASMLLGNYPSQRLFAIYGEMGAGKTTFIKYLCDVMNVIDSASSPSFAIVNVYQTRSNQKIYHFDFYRIKTLEEVYDIGYEDYFYSGDYCFLEWPERVSKLLPQETVAVTIEVDQNTQSRIVSF